MSNSPGGYSAAITSALDLDSPQEAVSSVKHVVSQELSALDRSAQIRHTEYFNHTYVPDLVLRWPRDQGRERHVYLRFTEQPGYLIDGLNRIDADVEHPMMFGLIPPRGSRSDFDQLDRGAFERRALVTDSEAMESFLVNRETNPVVDLLSNAITQGGRGFLDGTRSLSASQALADGFQGAKDLSIDNTRKATSILPEVLDSRQSDRLTRFLHAVWVGNGGTTDVFPGATDLTGDLSDEALEFLLSFEDISDLDFWRRVGRKVTVGQLARLRTTAGSINLARLIRANIDTLWARGCLIVPDSQPALDQPEELFYWLTENDTLALRGQSFTAYVSEQSDNVKHMARERFEGVAVNTLVARARDVMLNSLRLADGNDSLSFDSKNVMKDKRLQGLAERFSSRARVERAQAPLPSNANLNIDFLVRTAIGVTNSKPPLADLLMIAIRSLQGVSDEERVTLETMLTPPQGPDLEEYALFDLE